MYLTVYVKRSFWYQEDEKITKKVIFFKKKKRSLGPVLIGKHSHTTHTY